MDSLVTSARLEADDRFDTARITAAVDALAEKHSGREDVFRAALAQLLKAELIASRAAAQTILLKDRHGRRCAERLCFVQDEIIRILYASATKHLYRSPVPSGAERMAVVATGGYGRGLMAPESDIDLLFILPYKQTAWGEQVAEAILYCLWDMGLKVGHATRSVDESIRQARGDMTIRSRASTRTSCRARRRTSSPPSSPSARSATAAAGSHATWSNPTSRTAR